MFIVWGTTHAGKVDHVADLFHVVTQFGHLYYFPLIPTGSYIVLEKTSDGGFRGVPIPISGKSLLVGWLRGGCVVAMIATAVGCCVSLAESNKPGMEFAWMIPLLVGIIAGVVLFLSYRFKFITHASYERAVKLAKIVGINDMGMLMIEIAYGRLTAEQADAELARRDQEIYEAELTDQGNSVV